MTLNELLNILEKLAKQIERMKDNRNKIILCNDYYHYANLGVILFPEHNFDKYLLANEDIRLERFFIKERENIVNELFSNINALVPVYEELLTTYKEAGLICTPICIRSPMSPSKMETLIRDFFMYLGKDVYDLYDRMCDKGHILVSNDLNDDGYASNIINDDPYILLNSLDNEFYVLTALVHEMGHAYQFQLTKHSDSLSEINLTCEVFSMLFEKMFADYLLRINYPYKDVSLSISENHQVLLNKTCLSHIIGEHYLQNLLTSIDTERLIVTSMIPFEEIKTRVIMECGYLYKDELSIYDHIYVIDNIIADNLNNLIRLDFASGFKFSKNFIMASHYLPLKDIITKYLSNLEYTKTDIKKIAKVYHK